MLTLRSPLVRTVLADGLLAAGLTVLVLFGSVQAARKFPDQRPLDGLAVALMAAATAVLVLRRVRPVAVLVATVTACAAYLAADYPYGPMLLTMLVAMYTVATRLPARRSGLACLAGMLVVAAGAARGGPFLVLPQVAWLGWAALPWLLGLLVRRTREAVRRSREEEGERRVYEERLRAAREVHDVVGHGLAVISLQAGVALHVLERRPEQAQAALEVIRRASKDSLDELRATLAVFRADGSAPRRPAPGLGRLDALVTTMAGSGLAVELESSGQRYEPPAAVDLAAYRIVQESLTNVLRHAGPATARVRIGYGPDELRVEILDDGRAVPGGVADGLGLVGMRERAAGVGGTVEAGPRPEGGFRVLAVLPARAEEGTP